MGGHEEQVDPTVRVSPTGVAGDDPLPLLAFTIIVRLGDDVSPAGWAPWRDARDILDPVSLFGRASPYKRFPVQGLPGRTYFTPHVQNVLFPPAGAGRAERWLSAPSGMQLSVGLENEVEHVLRVELLELLRLGLPPHRCYGVIHLTYEGAPSAEQAMDCAAALHERYRPADQTTSPIFEVGYQDAEPERLSGPPLNALAESLFGSAHSDVYLQAWICALAAVPDRLPQAATLPWRRALGRGFPSLRVATDAIARSPGRDAGQTLRLGPATGIVLGRSAAFTHDVSPRPQLYNLRSYWSETLLFAIAAHDQLAGLAVELGKLGSYPLGPEVEDLYGRWLAFANVLGWGQLSVNTDVPQQLMPLAQRGLGTPPLRAEVDDAFARYVAQRRHNDAERQRVEAERQERALAGLQVYGAVFAAVGTAAAVLQVIGQDLFDCWPARAAVLFGLGILAVVVYTLMKRRVRSAADTANG